MQLNEFLSLEYQEKLRVLNRNGQLLNSFVSDKYQFTLYKVNDFYVELKRDISQLTFDSILAMKYEDLPVLYK